MNALLNSFIEDFNADAESIGQKPFNLSQIQALEGFLMGREFTLKGAMETAYYDYVNDFLTVEKWAEHYGVSETLAKSIICEFSGANDE